MALRRPWALEGRREPEQKVPPAPGWRSRRALPVHHLQVPQSGHCRAATHLFLPGADRGSDARRPSAEPAAVELEVAPRGHDPAQMSWQAALWPTLLERKAQTRAKRKPKRAQPQTKRAAQIGEAQAR